MMIPRFAKTASLCLLFAVVAGAAAYYTLTLIVKGEDTVVVPDLLGKEALYALETLTGLGLNTKFRESEFSEDHPKDHILHQVPAPGAEIKKGRDVRIVVSKGSRAVFAPDLGGLAVREADIILDANDLCRGNVSSCHSDMVRRGEIVSQFPSPGSAMSRGACVDLLVSLGRRQNAILMPDLRELSLVDAILSLEMNYLVLGEVESRFMDDRPEDTILDHRPARGYRVLAGSAVDLVRNRKSEQIEDGESYGAKGGHLLRYRLKSGFLKTRIRVELKNAGILDVIFDDIARPGEAIQLIIPDSESDQITLYEDDEPKAIRLSDPWSIDTPKLPSAGF